ncbi:MAG: class I SAM-dependent methyltransferase [Selenomonadaceae bacterium]|nr:class I SAM-dependent methyltransferase [Selenomonadaceae bacterium]
MPPPEYRFLDFAGGYGLLVRMMRDRGYDFYWYDKYAKDIFNPAFVDISSVESHYDAMTAYEVFEHLVNPFEELKIACNNTETLIFSTVIVPEGIEKVSDWWYFSPETGQHITFYTHKALAILGEKFKMGCVSLGNLHIYTRKQIDLNEFAKALQDPAFGSVRESLLQPDYQRVLQEMRGLPI